ncbi:putative ribonuclease H-like domain-containing protein, partial [Tanacetum coccineum]
VIELENTQNNALAKLPMLKLGEYEMWEIRIKQYFQIQDYALWEVIENRNSWVPIPVTSASETGASSTNDINIVNPEVSTATTKVKTASTEISTASFSDATVYAFLSTQPQGSQLVHEDLEQLHDDDLEEMDLKECKAPKSKDNINWNQGISSKTVKIEDASEKAMCAIDGTGFDWSNMAEEDIQANMALMAFSDSEVTNEKSCSKSCLKNYEALKKQYDDLLVKLDDTGFKAATYKRGLATLEDQIIKYREHEVLFSEEIALLKRSVGHKEYQMGLLRDELEKVKQEKEGFEFKIAKFDKSAKDLSEMLESQITDKSKKGVELTTRCNEYGPRDSSLKPTIGCDKESNNSKENTDDSLEQHQKTNTETRSVKSSLKVDKDWKEMFFCPANHVREVEPKKVRENNDALIIEDWVSDDEDDDEPNPKVEKKTIVPTATKKEFVKPEKPDRKSVRYAEMYRSQRPRGNQRNWNGQKSNQLGCNFVFKNKACFICGSFDHIQYSCPNQQRKRIVSGNNYNKKDNDYYSKTSHPSAHKHMAPRAVLMKTGLKSVNTARPVNTVRSNNTGRPFSTARSFNTVTPSYTAHPKSTVHCARLITYFQNQAQSTVHRPFYKRTTLTKRCYNQRFNTGRQNVNTVRARGFNAVKPSACWVWRPIKPNGASLSNSQLNDKGFVDSGCSRHMTGNIAHLSDFKDFDGGYVTFGGGAYGGRITGKEVENLVDKKGKNIQKLLMGTEFKQSEWNFCREKGIKREYSVARTPQQNGVAERKNRTLIEAARTMLADSKLPTTFWAESSFYCLLLQNRISESIHHSTESQDCNIIQFGRILSDLGDASPRTLILPDYKLILVVEKLVLLSLKLILLLLKTCPITTPPQQELNKDNPIEHVIGEVGGSIVQTRMMKTSYSEQGFLSAIYEGKTHQDLHTCLFVCFLSQEEPKRVSKALSDPAWVYKNKKDERGIVIRNKARLIAQGHTQEEGIDYDEVFVPVARIEAIRLFLAYASYMGFMVYQIDVKSAFLYGQIEEEVYVCQPLGFEDPDHPDKVYKYNYTDVKSASTPTDLEKPLVQDGDAADVDEHLYRSMIGSLMYLTASRPDIMFAVCACARFQVSPKTSHLLAVKRIFRYLKGKPSLGLWYSKDSPWELVAYTDSDYAGATQDRKSTTRGCQFLGNRHALEANARNGTVVATSTTEAEYVAAANCCGQVLWIQNQLLDYGYNFMNTVIYIDNNSTICIIENPVQHSKTKHIEIRHHFIRDCNAKKLIQMVKIDTEHNVADLLTKGFDAGRFQYLVSTLASPKQTAIGKDYSNPLMAGSLPKTILCVKKFAEATTNDNGEVQITATINGHSKKITEASLQRHLNDG